MMMTIEEKLAKSLTAESIELIPHLPYLLQDLWELGSSPKDMLEMITKHIRVSDQTRVLDLACGKGAVSVILAKKLGCRVKGIDIIPEFIDYAVNKAREFGVGELCEFVVGNIIESVKAEKDYDIVILGAVGDVLGNSEETITQLINTIKKDGYIILDDAYGNDKTNTKYPTREQWLTIFNNTGVRLIDEKIIEDDELASFNNEQQELIVKRANELKEELPEKARLFDSYIHSQQAECDELEKIITGVTMLLKAISELYKTDVEAILAKRHDNGADYWTTPDKRLSKGGPFSTLESALLLHELGMASSNPVLQDVAELIFDCQREDGRFKLSPNGAIYPCHTINATNVLCHLGYASDERLQKTFQHLFNIQYRDGGWRCNKFSYGRGSETEYSNPGTTLTALNVFRFTKHCNQEPSLERAVDFLLEHWIIRKPLGPCHYGIGSLFMQVEYPFANYNLFVYTYVLSFYDRAKKDERFLEALTMLESKMVEGKIVVERVNRELAEFSFCKKGKQSALATERYLELKRSLSRT